MRVEKGLLHPEWKTSRVENILIVMRRKGIKDVLKETGCKHVTCHAPAVLALHGPNLVRLAHSAEYILMHRKALKH